MGTLHGSPAVRRWVLTLACGLLCLTGCQFGQSGIDPPRDRLFFPAGISVDPAADWLYVVNSNSDLRYNAGTLATLDLQKVAADRAPGTAQSWQPCASNRFSRKQPYEGHKCCWDLLDSRVLNCDERNYVDGDATVRIGSFGGAIVEQSYFQGSEAVLRLFVAVRSDPSVTFVDVTRRGGRPSLRCTGARQGAFVADSTCSIDWRVQDAGTGADVLRLPEEPYTLALDPLLGVLYVGHLFGGVSTVDVCAPQGTSPPRLSATTPTIFQSSRAQGVTSLAITDAGSMGQAIFATSRFSSDVARLAMRSPDVAPCRADGVVEPRDLKVVPGETFSSSAFYPNGTDIRGVVLSPDGRRAYVLHRNESFNRRNPSAVAVVDRTVDERGLVANRAVGVVEVCPGPTEIRLHDAGRGPRLFVTCFEAGQIYVVDPEVLNVTAVIDAGRGPNTIVFPPNEPTLAFVAAFTDNTVEVLDLRPGSRTEYRVIQRIGYPHLATQ